MMQGYTLQVHQQPQPLLVLKKGLRTTPQPPRQSLARGLTAPPVALTLRYAQTIRSTSGRLYERSES